MWGEIIYPFLNFNGATVEVWEWESNGKVISSHTLMSMCLRIHDKRTKIFKFVVKQTPWWQNKIRVSYIHMWHDKRTKIFEFVVSKHCDDKTKSGSRTYICATWNAYSYSPGQNGSHFAKFWDAYSWMKMFVSWFIFQRQQAITWTNAETFLRPM